MNDQKLQQLTPKPPGMNNSRASLASAHINKALISVVIPCYNQAQFLSQAIESVVNQNYPCVELIVVDDGSVDNTAEVAARYPEVRCLRQHNQGLSAARNTGWRASQGDFLVFLDADDFLLPGALEAGASCLLANPDCAFVSGHYHCVNTDGSPHDKLQQAFVEDNHYQALLQGNYIGMHATVMYRRYALNEANGFDTALPACEDYDLYLRLARKYPISCHRALVAAYRQHEANMSSNAELMLKTALDVLHRQWPYVKTNNAQKTAYQTGLNFWKALYGPELITQIERMRMQGQKRPARHALKTLARSAPELAAKYLYWKTGTMTLNLVKAALPLSLHRQLQQWRGLDDSPPPGRIRFGDLRRLTPVSRDFGYERGQPIDRYYIEKFLERHAHDIHGRVLEIGDNTYTCQYGGGRVAISDVLHVKEGNPAATFVGDLTAADHLPSAAFDCVILTQTLHLIYDLPPAIQTLYRILAPGGILLATVPGISQLSADEWAESWYWAFTVRAIQKLFAGLFPEQNLQVESHGNVLAAVSFLQGLAVSELEPEELDHDDSQYQLLITIRAAKPALTR